MENQELIKTILRIEFPEKDFSDKEIEFLERYKIRNETEASILKSNDFLGRNFTKVKDYYKNKEHVGEARELLQKRRNIFHARKKKDPKAFGDFADFLEWWYSKVDENGVRKCCYCGIDEITCKKAFDKGILSSEKFTGTLHIERKNPPKGYNKDNCEFACALCNNAKSDMITEEDFKKFFENPMQKYWEHIKEELDKTEK